MRKDKNLNISKDTVKKGLTNAKDELGAFKKFISKGNVVDMAVGVIIGSAFSKIVSSLVDDIIMPIIGFLIGGLDFSNLAFCFNDTKIAYGNFIQSIVDFLIVAFCIFVVIRVFEKFKNKLEILEKNKKTEKDTSVSTKSDELIVMEEIRDLLKNKN